MKKLRVLLTGGGSGGHIFPLIAVGQELKKQVDSLGIPLDIRYFGGAREYAQTINDSGIYFEYILSSKLRRYWSLMNLVDVFKFFLSIFQLLWKILWFMPDVIFSKGGPGALATILVGRFYLIPVIMHESDSIPGLTNKISGKMAKKIFLAFSPAKDYFKNKDVEIIGNPVRESLFQQIIEQSQAQKGFGLNPNEPILLILGGSQGADRLNTFILESLEILIRDFQILHQVGKRNYDDYKKEFEFMTKGWTDTEKNRYIFRPFFDKDMSDALIAADIVVARAGAGTIFEIAAFGKPSVLIPLPESANDHQNKNAQLYSQTGAAVVIKQTNLLGNLFAEELSDLIKDEALLQKMGESAKSFYRPDTAMLIAKHLLTYVS